MLAALILAGLAAQAPDPIVFESVRFVAQDGEVYSLSSGEAAPGGTPGALVADFEFTWPGGPPALAALWRIDGRNSEYLTRYVAAGWKGLGVAAGAHVAVLTYDLATGIGSATLSLPVGVAYPLEQRFPLLPEQDCRVDVVIGLEGQLDVGAGGGPTGGLWEGTVRPFVCYPEVWVDVYSPVIGPGGDTIATLYSREQLSSARSYVLEIEHPDIVRFGPRPGLGSAADRFPPAFVASPLSDGCVRVELPADAVGLHFGLVAGATGEYRVRVREESGADKGRSAIAWSVEGGSALRREQVVDAAGNVLVSDATLALLSANGAVLETVDSELDTSPINRECKKAECQGYLIGIFDMICGECSLHPDVPDECDSRYGAYYATLAECKYVRDLDSGCLFDRWTILKCKLYSIDREYELTADGCPQISTASNVFDVIFGAKVQTYRYCCIRKEHGSLVKRLQVKQCRNVSG